MSGAEAGFVIGLIGSLISIVDAIKKVYDAAGDANGQPGEFRQVAARLPLVIEILHSVEAAAPELDDTKQEAIEPILKSCKAKAEKLQEIFQKVIRKDDGNWFDRYKKALRTLGKGDKVEYLMEGIQKDTQLLACEKLMGIATEEQVKRLEEGIREMNDLSSSVQEDTLSVTQTHSGTGDNIGHSGSGNNYGGNSHHNQNSGDVNYGNDDPKACLKDLRTTDPRDDKRRIEETKGGLLRDSYIWILENSEFRRWHDDKQSQLLWIRGDPGKGKTMLLCGIIDKLKDTSGTGSASGSCLLSYFFCQATDERINSATAVLRGLIYLLVHQQPALLTHVRKKYDASGKELFVDTNSWFALSEIFINIMQDPSLGNAYVIIDALDECKIGLQQLLQLIDKTLPVCPCVKWIVSSRNWPSIEERIRIFDQKIQLRLELNQDSISAAVSTYIEHKVGELAKRKKYNAELESSVRENLSLNADATFLWVALVLKELETIDRRDTLTRVRAFPPGLGPLYEQMMAQISESNKANLCKRILSIVAVVRRPITLEELVSLDDILHKLDCPEDLSEDLEDLEQTVCQCGSFLTIRESTVHFVHQSAKDFLLQENTSQELLRSGISEVHHTIFSRSLQVMSMALRRDVYSLRAPGIMIEQVKQPDPDPLAAARYSCLYWVDHLLGCMDKGNTTNHLKDGGLVHNFLSQSFLYWLEALSLMRSFSDGIIMIKKLENWLQADESPDLFAFIHDAKRFALYNRSGIEQAPLQLYCSALIFAPDKSIIRETFEKYITTWIQRKPKVQAHWSAALQTLEGHLDSVNSVAFSPNGTQVVSGSRDDTVRLWDVETGVPLQTLKGHFKRVNSVAFSPDGTQVVSGSTDKTVRLWDAETGRALQTLKGHLDWINSVAFSPDGIQVVSGSYDNTVRLWNAETGAALQTLEGHSKSVSSVAFSPNGTQVVSGSYDNTVRLWNAETGGALQTLEGHSDWINSVAFSPDSTQVVSGSKDNTVRLWNAETGVPLQTLEGHSKPVSSVAFSPDGTQVVSGSYDNTVRLWNAETGAALQTLEGHSKSVSSVAFSPNGTQVVSGSYDNTVRLWNAETGGALQTFEGHSNSVDSVAFSPDGIQVVSGSYDNTVRLWDTATRAVLQTLEGHLESVNLVAFSPNGTQVISSSKDKTMRLWDVATGATLKTLEGHSKSVNSVAFSPNGTQVVSGSTDKTVRLWDAATGAALQTLEGHSKSVNSVAFSPDGTQVISDSGDGTVRYWDTATGALLRKDKGYRLLYPSDLRVENHWLVEGDADILWLPTEYRPTCGAVWGKIVVSGHASGRISFLQMQQGPKLIT